MGKQYLDEKGLKITVGEIQRQNDKLKQGISLSSGTNNGTLKLTVEDRVVDDIPVTGLKDTAYLPSSSFSPVRGSASLSQLAQSIRLGGGAQGEIYQNSANYHQKFEILDNESSGDAVFKFSQSSDTGATFSTLAEICDDGNVVAKTFTGNLSGKVNGYGLGQWNAIPYIRNDGVMELGKFLDFHISADSKNDYDIRLTANNGYLQLSGGFLKGDLQGNVTGNLTGVASKATLADKLTKARTVTIGKTSRSDDGSGNLSWSLSDMGAAAASHSHTSFDAVNITGLTVDVYNYNLAAGTIRVIRFIEKTSAGSTNITNIPVTGEPFILIAELVRWGSATDYVTKQTFISKATKSAYERWCTNGSWTNWLPNARFSLTPVSGQVLIADGTAGQIKSSGFTIGKSVPPNAVFTDTNTMVTNTLAATSKAYITGTTSATTATTTHIFDTGVYLGTEAGQLVAAKFTGALDGNAKTATRAATADKFTATRSIKIGNTAKNDSGNNGLTWTLAELGAVNKTGDTMTGLLTLKSDPTSALHAATKQYVDNKINTSLSAVDYMHMIGTVGSNGTVAELPATNIKAGDSYKVITAFTLAADKSHSGEAVNAKVGDTFVAMTAAPKWLHIPSGDEPTTYLRYSTTTTNLTTSAKTGDIILGYAAAKQVDSSIAIGTSSTNLPTSAAVANYALKKTGDSMSGSLTLSGNLYLTKGATAGETQEIRFTCGANDYARIQTGGEKDLGYLEIATSDNANEPIYFRQYTGSFTTAARTLTLLDGSGNSSFPGTISSKSFIGNVTGNLNTGSAINSSLSTGTYLEGNKGKAIVNSTAGAGSYTMLAKMNSTNGYFTHGNYQDKYLLQYTSKSTVDEGTNNVTKSVCLLNEAGNTTFPGTVTAPTFSGNATTATKATQDSAGQPINTTYIKGLTASGRTITYTKGNGSTGTLTTQDTTYPIAGKSINADFSTKYRTQTKGNTTRGYYISAIRNDTPDVANSPQYGSGIAFGNADTHSYLYTAFGSTLAYIGGGNADQLNWVKQIAFTDSNISGNAASSTRLKNYFSSRPTSANIAVIGDGSIFHFKATDSMTEGKPPVNSQVLHFEWDNAGGYTSQLAISNGTGHLYSRGMSAGKWNNWITFLDSTNYSSYTLPKTGGTLDTNTFYGLTLKRKDTNGSAIQFSNSNGTLIGVGAASDKTFVVSSEANTNGNMFKVTPAGKAYAGGTELSKVGHGHTTLTPIASKTYTGCYATANDFANATFYFGTVKPTDYYVNWRIKYRIHSSIPGQNNYKGLFDVELLGAQNSRIVYKVLNSHYSTSYRTLYYHVIYSATSTGFNAGYGHALGIGLRNSTNPTSASYPRTFKIEVLETANCSVTMFDGLKLYSGIPGTGSTNYSGYGEWDGFNNGLRETGDDNNYDRLVSQSARVYAGTNKIYPYTIIMEDSSGKWQSIVMSNTVAMSKSKNATGFRPERMFYYHSGSTVSSSAQVATTTLYQAMNNVDIRYSTNCGTTLTTFKPVYLVGTLNKGLFYLTDSWYTQTLPVTDDGKAYIYLGETYSTYAINFSVEHPIYWYKNGAVREYPDTGISDNTWSIGDCVLKYNASAKSLDFSFG